MNVALLGVTVGEDAASAPLSASIASSYLGDTALGVVAHDVADACGES